MERGWQVFTPQSVRTKADFLAVSSDENQSVLKVQVKTVQENGEYLQTRITVKERNYTLKEIDVFVFVYKDRMWEIPHEKIQGLTTINFGRIDRRSLNNRVAKFDPSPFEIH